LYAAAIITQLRRDGKLHLDDSITGFLQNQDVTDLHILGGIDRTNDITIRHLLSHTSGLAEPQSMRNNRSRRLKPTTNVAHRDLFSSLLFNEQRLSQWSKVQYCYWV